MNKQQRVLFIAAFALMAGAAGLLVRFHTHQQLGSPGVKTSPLAGSQRLLVDLPEHVLDYDSKFVEVDELTTNSPAPVQADAEGRYPAPIPGKTVEI